MSSSRLGSRRLLLGFAPLAAVLLLRAPRSRTFCSLPAPWEASLRPVAAGPVADLAHAQRPCDSSKRWKEPRSWTALGSVGLCCGATLAALAGSRHGRVVGRRGKGSLHRQLGRRVVDARQDLSTSVLYSEHASKMSEIRTKAGDLAADQDDLAILRLVLEHQGDAAAAAANLEEIVRWRTGEGKDLVEAARVAVAEATAGGAWDNGPVLAAAPHSHVLGKYYTPSQYVVLTLQSGDLLCCIRAAAVEVGAMMDEVAPEDLLEFFLYAREVNSLVADARSRRTGKLVRLVSANDFTGVVGPPDKRFQQALGDLSNKASTLWPGLAGPTIMLNLPALIRFLVQCIAPMFPGAVQQRIRFAKNRLSYFDDLSETAREPVRSRFIADIQKILDE